LLLLRNLKEKTLLEQMASGEIILAPVGEQIVGNRNFYTSFVAPVDYTVECEGGRLGVLAADSVPRPDEAILLACHVVNSFQFLCDCGYAALPSADSR
jgi:hypothetical protein